MDPLICNCVIYLSTDVPFNNNYPEQGSLTKERVRLGEILQDKENIIQSQRLDNVVFIFPQNFSRDIKTILSIIFLSSTQHVSALALLTCDKQIMSKQQKEVKEKVNIMLLVTSLIISAITFLMTIVTSVLWSWSTGHFHPFCTNHFHFLFQARDPATEKFCVATKGKVGEEIFRGEEA